VSARIDCSALAEAAEAEIRAGLTACQLAVGYRGEVVWRRAFGSADDDTRFWVASATKPIVSAAVWLLIGDGKLDVSCRVADILPGFGANGKQDVTVEQVMLMTAGFPDAPMTPEDGADPTRRIAQMAEWTLETEPGSAYAYHPMSAHWVLAALIERIAGQDHCDFVEQRLTGPIGLPRVLGIPREAQGVVAQLSPAADEATRSAYDYAAKIAAGEPGGGGLMRAADLALFYQTLLHDPAGLFDPAVLADGTGHVRCTLPDPQMGLPANRTLGVVVGPGFGATWGESPTAFGWPGAGGQIAFAEPATGISVAFLQMGDTDPVRPFVRGRRISQLALQLGA